MFIVAYVYTILSVLVFILRVCCSKEKEQGPHCRNGSNWSVCLPKWR